MKEFHINTYSIIGYDPRTKGLGIAVASKWLAVGGIVPFIKAGVGAIATQALSNISFGPLGLEILESGKSSEEVLKELLKGDFNPEARQFAVMDIYGNGVCHTGNKCIGWAGGIISKNCVVQGNMLVGESVVISIRKAFESTKGDLAQKLYAALLAGNNTGGDIRGKQSSSLLVINTSVNEKEVSGNIIDLRVDDSKYPVEELGKLLDKHYSLYK